MFQLCRQADRQSRALPVRQMRRYELLHQRIESPGALRILPPNFGQRLEEGDLPFGVTPGVHFDHLLDLADSEAAASHLEELPITDAPHSRVFVAVAHALEDAAADGSPVMYIWPLSA